MEYFEGVQLVMEHTVRYYRHSDDLPDDDFDVDDFIRRMTRATGLDVQEVTSSTGNSRSAAEDNNNGCFRRFSVRTPDSRASRSRQGSADSNNNAR